jgi:NADH dehydrogenase FAD-containing subunit
MPRHVSTVLLTQSSGILSAPQIDALRKATEQSLEQQQRRVMTKKTVRSIENTAVQASPAGATARPGS